MVEAPVALMFAAAVIRLGVNSSGCASSSVVSMITTFEALNAGDGSADATAVNTLPPMLLLLLDSAPGCCCVCAFNCHLLVGTAWYRGLLWVNGKYLYLIMCCGRHFGDVLAYLFKCFPTTYVYAP